MARSPAFSAATEQARLQAVIAAAGSGAKLWVYAGTQPGGPDTASHGQTLLAGPFVFPATLGTASSTAPARLTIDCTATPACIPAVTGTPTWWRLTTSAGSDGSAGLADGSAGTAGTVDLLLPVVIAGRPIGIKSWAISSFETRVSATIGMTEAVDVLAATGEILAPSGIGATNQRTGVFYPGAYGPREAGYAAANGDVILIIPGVYVITPGGNNWGINKNITLRSSVTGQRWTLDASAFAAVANSTAISMWYPGVTATIEDGEIYGNLNNADGTRNAAIAYFEAGINLTVRNCILRNCTTAVIGTLLDNNTGSLVMDKCEVKDCGGADTRMHGIYMDYAASVVLRGCWFHNTASSQSYGHLVKSRARVTTIEWCRITMEAGHANRCIDLPQGGDVTIRGNLIEYCTDQNAGGGQFVSFGVEDATSTIVRPWSTHNLLFRQNTVVNHAAGSNNANLARFMFWIATDAAVGTNRPLTTYSVIDNVFAGDYLPANKDGYYGAEGNVYAISSTTNTVISSANMATQMPNNATYDFTLTTPVAGTQNWAAYYYAHPTSYIARADAYRGGVPSGTVVNSVWTPAKDGTGTITDASWSELPLYTVVEWSGTSLQSQLTPPYGIAGGLTFTDYGTTGVADHFDGWGGAAFDDATGRFWTYGGGHAGSTNNMLALFDARKGTWTTSIPPTANQYMPASYKVTGLPSYTAVTYPSGLTYGYFPSAETPPGDDKPLAMHVYSGIQYVAGTLVKIRGPGFFGNKYGHASVDAATPSWSAGGTASRTLLGVSQQSVVYNGFLYWGMEGGQAQDNQYWTIIKYNPATGQEVTSFGIPPSTGASFDFNSWSAQTTSNRWFVTTPNLSYVLMNLDTGGAAASGTMSGRLPTYYDGILAVYVPDISRIVLLNAIPRSGGAGAYEWLEVDPSAGTYVTSRILDPHSKTPALSVNYSVHGRARYWSTKKVLILHSRTMQNARVVRFG